MQTSLACTYLASTCAHNTHILCIYTWVLLICHQLFMHTHACTCVKCEVCCVVFCCTCTWSSLNWAVLYLQIICAAVCLLLRIINTYNIQGNWKYSIVSYIIIDLCTYQCYYIVACHVIILMSYGKLNQWSLVWCKHVFECHILSCAYFNLHALYMWKLHGTTHVNVCTSEVIIQWYCTYS